jgi:AcrR family transcriptional regulator
VTSDAGLVIDEHEGLTLRERKRLAAREALSSAAIRLAMEKGLEHVRVEDIAAEVGVSPRTFNNYFSSKEEAICAITIRRNGRIADLLLGRPADEPIWTAVTNAVSEHYGDMTGDAPREFIAKFRLLLDSDALRGEFLKAHGDVERKLGLAVAQRTGTDVERDLGPMLLAGAITSAMRVGMHRWLKHDRDATLADCVRAALDELANGLPSLKAKAVNQSHHNRDD